MLVDKTRAEEVIASLYDKNGPLAIVWRNPLHPTYCLGGTIKADDNIGTTRSVLIGYGHLFLLVAHLHALGSNDSDE